MSFILRPACVRSAALWVVTGVVLVFPRPGTAQVRPSPRISLSVNAGTQNVSRNFTSESVLKINQEDGDVTARYAVRSASSFDIGGSVRVWRRLRLGVAVSQFEKARDAGVIGHIPHPFFFGQPRTVEGSAAGMTRRERAVHIQAAWTFPLTRRFDITVLGGPTFATVKQDLVSGVAYTENFPFDTATFTSAESERRSTDGVGLHVGADIAFPLTRQIGLGALIRFSRTSVNLDVPLGNRISVRAGGLHAGGGVRIGF